MLDPLSASGALRSGTRTEHSAPVAAVGQGSSLQECWGRRCQGRWEGVGTLAGKTPGACDRDVARRARGLRGLRRPGRAPDGVGKVRALRR